MNRRNHWGCEEQRKEVDKNAGGGSGGGGRWEGLKQLKCENKMADGYKVYSRRLTDITFASFFLFNIFHFKCHCDLDRKWEIKVIRI
jgi:hypothetical protein